MGQWISKNYTRNENIIFNLTVLGAVLGIAGLVVSIAGYDYDKDAQNKSLRDLEAQVEAQSQRIVALEQKHASSMNRYRSEVKRLIKGEVQTLVNTQPQIESFTHKVSGKTLSVDQVK